MKKSVLVVDDDLAIRQSLVDVLEDEGYKVLSAENGREGLKVLKQAEPLPGLIILDVMMPVLDGAGFCEEQLKSPLLSSVPTVLFSANSHLPQGPSLKNKEFIRKPFDLHELLAIVERFCGT